MNTLLNQAFAKATAQNNAAPLTTEFSMADAFDAENKGLQLELAELNTAMASLSELDDFISFSSNFEAKGMSTDTTAFFINRAQEIREKLGIAEEITLSMEDFAGTSSENIDALTTSLSGLKNIAVNGWEALIKFLKDIYEKIMVFVTKLMDTMPALKKKAEELKEKIDDVTGSAENSKIKIGGLTKLAGRNKDITLDHFTTNMAELFDLDAAKGMIGLASVSNFDSLDTNGDGVKALKPSALKIKDEDIDKVQDGLDDADTGAPEANAIGRQDDTVKGIYELPGAKAYVVAVAPAHGKNEEEGNDALVAAFKRVSSIKVGIRSEVKDPKFDKDKEVKTLSTSEMHSICDTVIAGADALEKSKGSIEDGRKAIQQLTKVADKMKNNAGKSEYKDVKGALNAAKTAIGKLAGISAPHRDIAAYFYTTAEAGLGYCTSSLKEYK